MKKLALIFIISTFMLSVSDAQACTMRNQGIDQIFYDYKNLDLEVTNNDPEPIVRPAPSGMPIPINTCPKRQIDQSYLNFLWALRGATIVIPVVSLLVIFFILKKRKS